MVVVGTFHKMCSHGWEDRTSSFGGRNEMGWDGMDGVPGALDGCGLFCFRFAPFARSCTTGFLDGFRLCFVVTRDEYEVRRPSGWKWIRGTTV